MKYEIVLKLYELKAEYIPKKTAYNSMNYVDIQNSKIIELVCKYDIYKTEIDNDAKFNLHRVKNKGRVAYILEPIINETNHKYFINIDYLKYVKLKFLKGEYPTEISALNAILIPIILSSIVFLIRLFFKQIT